MSNCATLDFYYVQPGCVDKCCHRLPYTWKRVEHVNNITREKYQVLEITPHCAQCDKRAAFRTKIYQDANNAADKAADRCKTTHGKMRARKREWDKVTKPWAQGPCPFFELG